MWNVQRNGVTIQQWPREEFVLLDVVVCGVCSTDFALHRFPFPLPIVGGHEVVVSNGTQRFCVEINCSHAARGLPDADKCHFCNADSATPSQCPERRTVGIDTLLGGFAPVMLVPRFSLCPVPASVPTRLAVLAEPFAAALHAVRSVVAIPLDASVCVLGARKLGVMIVLALHCLRYSRVTAIGHSAAAVQVCSELGATTLLDGRGRTASFDVVFDCTGSPAGFDEATALAKTGGIVHVKSTGGKPVGELQYATASHSHESSQHLRAGVVSSMTAIVVDEIAILSQRPERAQPEWQWRVHGAWDAHDCLLVDAHSGGDGIAHSVVVVPSFDDVDRVHAAGLVLPRGAIVVTAPPAAEEGTCWNRVASKQLQGDHLWRALLTCHALMLAHRQCTRLGVAASPTH